MDDVTIRILLGGDETSQWRAGGAAAARARAALKRLARRVQRASGSRLVEICGAPEYDADYGFDRRPLLWHTP